MSYSPESVRNVGVSDQTARFSIIMSIFRNGKTDTDFDKIRDNSRFIKNCVGLV